jgi:hypothetical protein
MIDNMRRDAINEGRRFAAKVCIIVFERDGVQGRFREI